MARMCYNTMLPYKNARNASKLYDESASDTKNITLVQSYRFFENHTAGVEVMFKSITKVYFSIPPSGKFLNREIRAKFENSVDRSSTKVKLEYLLKEAPNIIEEIKHEYWLSNLYKRYTIVNIIMSRAPLWRDFAGTLFSYNNHGNDRLEGPSLFFKAKGWNDFGLGLDATMDLIIFLAAFQCLFSAITYSK